MGAAVSMLEWAHRRIGGFMQDSELETNLTGELAFLIERLQSPDVSCHRADDVRVWAWHEPLGAAADDPRIIQLVGVSSFRQDGLKTAEDTADQMCNAILARGLKDGQVAILPQGLGMGEPDPTSPFFRAPALYRHAEDGVQSASVSHPWITPWMSHGIRETGSWMDDFIARYKERQRIDPTIPDPSRFHLNSERVIGSAIGNTALSTFAAMTEDQRWFTERVPGFRDRTMAELYALAGEPVFDVGRHWTHEVNREWSIWYQGLGLTATDAGLDEAVYQRVKRAWPTTRTSNSQTSVRVDGKGDPPHEYTHSSRFGADWFRFIVRGSADFQAPLLYDVDEAHLRPGESLGAATLRVARSNVDACLESFPRQPSLLTPWILKAGTTATRNPSYIITKADNQDMLAMLRDRRIHEIILWNNASGMTEASWNEFVEALNEVWAERSMTAGGESSRLNDTTDGQRPRWLARAPGVEPAAGTRAGRNSPWS